MTRLTDKHRLISDIEKAQHLFDMLRRLYERIPITTCHRQTRCCALMPEVSYVEFLHMVEAFGKLDQDVRREIMEKTIKYFFLNAVQIETCPFLNDTTCLIYENRPYTCRAYGLWSKAYYEMLVAKNKEARKPVLAAWETLGIKLPAHVLAYQPAYCDKVTVTFGEPVTDSELDLIQAQIHNLDAQLENGTKRFTQAFFSDPSFLLASAVMGYQSCLTEKVTVVREYLSNKRSSHLEQLIDNIAISLENGYAPYNSQRTP